MSIFYIQTELGGEPVRYFLDSTPEVSRTILGVATDFPLEGGSSVADNYVVKGDRISFRGTISSIKSGAVSNLIDVKTPDAYIRGLESLLRSGKPFTVNTSNHLDPVEDCVFESFKTINTPQRGFSGELSSYSISLTMKKIRFGKVLLVTQFGKDTEIINDQTNPKQDSGKSAQTSETERVLNAIASSPAGAVGIFPIFPSS